MMPPIERFIRPLILVSVCLFFASVTRAAADEKSVFVREAVSAHAYEDDFVACNNYARARGASDGASAGAAVVGALIGGILGGGMVQGSLDKTQNRLFEECMSLKGYRLIALPQGFIRESRTENDEFDRRKTGLELIAEKKSDELIAWENAKNFGGQKRLQRYLQTYPNGHFAADTRKLLSGNGEVQTGNPK